MSEVPESSKEIEPPNILNVIRMYRRERDWDYPTAKAHAIDEFKKRGWPIPNFVKEDKSAG